MPEMQHVERALDVALIVMRNGGSTALADRAFGNVLAGFNEKRVPVVWRLDSVTAPSVAEDRPAAILRPVGPVGVNLVRVSEAVILGDRMARGEVGAAALPSEIARINSIAAPFGRWSTVAAAAFAAAAFSQLAGADWEALGVAFVAGFAGQYVRLLLQARAAPFAFVTLVSGLLSAGIAAAGLRMDAGKAVPWTMIASVAYMIPGLPLINGFVDVLSHRFLYVGLQRIANALLIFVIIAIAIALAHAIIM